MGWKLGGSMERYAQVIHSWGGGNKLEKGYSWVIGRYFLSSKSVPTLKPFSAASFVLYEAIIPIPASV